MPERGTVRPRAGRWLVLLAAAHALILVGAFFLIEGARQGLTTWVAVGTASVVVGIALELAVAVWSATTIRRLSARSGGGPPLRANGSIPLRRVLCPHCGWMGQSVGGAACARCGRPVVRTP